MLTDTLTAAQQAAFKNPLVRLVVSHGGTSHTFTGSRILDLKEGGDGSLQSCEVVLDNNDGELSDLDVKGYKAILSYG